MKIFINDNDIAPLIERALREDIGDGDVTSLAIFEGSEVSDARIIAKENGIFCGSSIAAFVYRRIDPTISVTAVKHDGDAIASGETALTLHGPTGGLLTGERTVLNFLQRMCGIATRTRTICDMLAGTGITVLDTRKTLPGFRLLDKYAVKAGGGTNHRMGLFDMVMIKDNHIAAAGGISNAVEKIRNSYGSKYRVEVETTTIEEVREALAAGADIIMLDNMTVPLMRNAVEVIGGRAKTEISGNIDERQLDDVKSLGVDYISIGALTHSVKAFDLSMKFE